MKYHFNKYIYIYTCVYVYVYANTYIKNIYYIYMKFHLSIVYIWV